MLVSALGMSCSPEETLQKPEQIGENIIGIYVPGSVPYELFTATWYNLGTGGFLVINDAQTLENYLTAMQLFGNDLGATRAEQNPIPVDFNTETVLLAYGTTSTVSHAQMASYKTSLTGKNKYVMTVDLTGTPLTAFSDWRVSIIVPKVSADQVSLVVNHIYTGDI
jgi:hypothetical protein